MLNSVITIKTIDKKFAKDLINFLANYPKVENDSTVIIIGEDEKFQKKLLKTLDEPNSPWYNDDVGS